MWQHVSLGASQTVSVPFYEQLPRLSCHLELCITATQTCAAVMLRRNLLKSKQDL